MQYKITGDDLPVVICTVDANETLITESGSMSWMSPNMKMETTSNGGIGKALGRLFPANLFSLTNIPHRAAKAKSLLLPVSPVPFGLLMFPKASGSFKKAAFLPAKIR